jgi:peptide/nickel transport system substrate-binding protein
MTQLVLPLFLAACSNQQSEVLEIGYGLTLSPTGIDPHINASVELGIPLTSVYDTLIYQNPETLEYVPSLSNSWDVSADGRVYRFELRRDVRFHDGSPFNAEAVRANIDYVIDPANRSQKAAEMLGPLAEVRVLDEFIVEFILLEPFQPLLDGDRAVSFCGVFAR